MPVTIEFPTPSYFKLCGPGIREWRVSKRQWVDGAQFTPQYKKGFWDGYTYPGYWHDGNFYLGRGFFEIAIRELNATVLTPPPTFTPVVAANQPNLRDYQREALRLILQKRWGCVALATNAGKGAIISLAAKAIAECTQGQVLICCDEVSIFQALFSEITKWTGREPATITAGWKTIPKDPLVLAMVPTLYRRISGKTADPTWRKWVKSLPAVMLDEADKASSPSWQKLLGLLENTHYRVGFSGTFPDLNTPTGMVIQETVGPILLRVSNIELVNRGVSARPTVHLLPFDHPETFRKPEGWWEWSGMEKRHWVFQTYVADNEERHRFVASLVEEGHPTAIIVNYIEHGRNLELAIPGAVFLHGRDSPEERTRVLEAFQKREFMVLIVTKILDRGTNDLGHATDLILASGQGSDRQTLQRIGRGLRRTEGKEFLSLKDVVDRGHRYFATMSSQRVRLYDAEDFEVKIEVVPRMGGIGIHAQVQQTERTG